MGGPCLFSFTASAVPFGSGPTIGCVLQRLRCAIEEMATLEVFANISPEDSDDPATGMEGGCPKVVALIRASRTKLSMLDQC